MDFAPYHSEITAVNLSHLTLILVLYLVQLLLAHKAHQTGDGWYAVWIPLLSVSMFGLVCRLDILVKRLGGWLASMGDPWEKALSTHLSRKLMAGADAIVFLPALLPVLIYAHIKAWEYWGTQPGLLWIRPWYLLITNVFLLAAIALWVYAAMKAQTGFTAKGN